MQLTRAIHKGYYGKHLFLINKLIAIWSILPLLLKLIVSEDTYWRFIRQRLGFDGVDIHWASSGWRMRFNGKS